jgi:hypothetical protein
VQADYARHAAEALGQLRHLEKVVRDAAPEDVRNALGGLVERITPHFDYRPAHRNGNRPTTLTSLGVTMRPEAAGLLGAPGELRRSARRAGPPLLLGRGGRRAKNHPRRSFVLSADLG